MQTEPCEKDIIETVDLVVIGDLGQDVSYKFDRLMGDVGLDVVGMDHAIIQRCQVAG